MSSVEQHIAELIAAGNKQQAVAEITNLIKTAVNTGNFRLAEQWREKLIEADSMALSAIIATAEMIEEGKAAGIDAEHQQLWKPLLEQLTEEEAVAFYYALTAIDLPPGTPIIEQGKLNNRLFFINQGRINVLYQKGAQQLLLFHLEAGETAGEDTFFGISVATATFICHSSVKLRYLDRQKIAKWPDDYPGLREKIFEFCKKFGHVDSAINTKLLDRRVHNRFPSSNRVSGQLFNEAGQPLGSVFPGFCTDISQGGICFYIKCSSTVAQQLLGRQLQLKIITADAQEGNAMTVRGLVVGVKYHLHNDYTVHVRFTSLLQGSQVLAIADSDQPLPTSN